MRKFLFIPILVLFSCSFVRSVPTKVSYQSISDESKKEDIILSSIYVYIGDLSLGESGTSAEGGININGIGGRVMLTAWGKDIKGKVLWVNPRWSTNYPELLKIEPDTGSKVILTGLGTTYGNIELYVEAMGVKRTFSVFISE